MGMGTVIWRDEMGWGWRGRLRMVEVLVGNGNDAV